MIRRAWPLRSLIGGIYFFIIVVILGSLTIYLSHLITENNRETIIADLTGQARLSAELLANYLNDYIELDTYLSGLKPSERDRPVTAAARSTLFGPRRDDYLLPAGQVHAWPAPETAISGEVLLTHIEQRLIDGLISISKSTAADRSARGYVTPYRITVMRTNGEIIAERPPHASDIYSGPALLPPEVVDALKPDTGRGVSIRYSTKYESEMMFIAVPVQGSRVVTDAMRQPAVQRITRGVLLIAMPTDELSHTTLLIHLSLLLAFIGALLVLFIINIGISHLITRPLATLNWTANQFAQGELDRRVHPAGALEIASLGASFNTMAAQLSSTIAHLAEERAQAQAVLTGMFDGVLVTDETGRILLINQSFERMFDMQAAAVIGLNLSETTFRGALDELWHNTITTGLPLMHEVTFGIPTERVFEVHMAPVEVAGRLRGVVIVLYDITALRQFARMQRDFVANVSHELRTPVASIRAMAETLADAGGEDPELAREFLASIIHESERLTGLLEDLLQLSRMESGRLLIAPEPTDLSVFIRQIAQRAVPLLAAKAQQLSLAVPETLPAEVDRDAFTQILVNLLENARKYSPEGASITVQAEAAEDRVRLRVSDTGIGIAEDELERIFERFYRVDKARSRAQGGTGLGLAIVRHLVELHGGWVSVQSQLGQGSTFTVVLPQTKMPARPPAGAEEAGELPAVPRMPAAGADGEPV